MERSVKEHVMAQLRQVELETYPFPFIYVSNIFPDNFYQNLLSQLPDDRFYHQSSSQRTSNPYSLKARRRVNLANEDVEHLSEAQKAFWGELLQFFDSWEFQECFVSKFKPHLLRRYKRLQTKIRVELLRDTTEYRISPHTDAPHKIFTLLFYLPRNHSLRHLGTSIYLPKTPGFVDEAGTQFDFNDFELYRKVDCLPKTLFCFMKTDCSFHGREPIVENGVQRDLLNCSIQHA